MAATITGTFVILDKATGPMQKMERQAIKTMAAIEALGHAMDKTHGGGGPGGVGGGTSKVTRAVEHQTKAMKGNEQQARRSSHEIRKLDADMKRLGGTGGGLVNSLGRIGGAFVGLKGIFTALRIPLMIAGFVQLGQAATALGAGVIALVPALAQAGAAIAALPQIASAAVQGFGVLKLAMGGVADAFKAAMQMQVQHTQVAQATADAQRNALHAVGEAEYSLGQTQRGVTQAQIALTQARRDAVRELTDLKLAAIGADLSQKRAGLSLRQARQAVSQASVNPNTTAMQMQDLRLGVQEAQLQVRQAGVNKNRAHVDARRGPQTVGRQVQQAEFGLQDAQHAQANAAYQLADAQRQLTRVMKQGVGVQATYLLAMKQLSPAAQHFVKHLVAMRPAVQKLRAAAAQGLFPGLDRSLSNIQRAFPMLQRLSGRTGRVLGNAADRASARFTTTGRQNDIEALGKGNDKILNRMAQGASNLVAALMDFMVAAQPFTDWLTHTIYMGTVWVAKWARANRENGKFAKYLEGTKKRLQMFWRMLKNVGVAFREILKAATPLGDRLWKGAEKATKAWADWATSAKGRNDMRKYFDDTYKTLHLIGQLLHDLVVEWFKMQGGSNRDNLNHTLVVLDRMIKPVTGALSSFIDVLSKLDVSPLQIMLDTFSRLMKMLSWLISNVPGVKYALDAVLALVLLKKANDLLGGLTGKWRGLFSMWRSAPPPPMGPGGMGPGGMGPASGRPGRGAPFGSNAAGPMTARGAYGVSRAAGASRFGAAAGVAGLGLRAVGRAAWPIALGLGALDFATTQGTVGERFQGALHMGGLNPFVSAPELGVDSRSKGEAHAQGVAAHGQGAVSAQIAHLQARLGQSETFNVRPGRRGMPGHAAARTGTRTENAVTGDARDRATAELKALRVIDAQMKRERILRLDAMSRDNGQRLARGFGQAYAIYDKHFGPTKAMGLTTSSMLQKLQGMRPAGRRVLAQNTLAWARQMAADNPKLQGVVRDMQAGIIAKYKALGRDIKIVNGQILDGSKGQWDSISRALSDPVEKARQKVSKGFTDMQRQAIGSLELMGFSKSEAKNIIRGLETGGGAGKAAANTAAAGAGGLSAAKKQLAAPHGPAARGAARGGRIMGRGDHDTVPVAPGNVAAPGELIVNKHTESRVNRALRMHGTTLGHEVFRESTPHYAHATGGRIRSFAYGGVTGPVADMIGKLDSQGFHHGSTTGGGHAPNSYHYKGMAVDYGDASNDMQRLWSVVYPKRKQFAELFGPATMTPGPTLMHNGAGFSDPTLQAGHNDHIHLALTGAGGALGDLSSGAAGSGGAAAQIVAPNVGVKGAAGAIGQVALQAAAAGLNRRLAAVGGGGGLGNLDGFSGGGSSAANQTLGRKMMLAAGFSANQWPALKALWTGESNWNEKIRNKSSGATGIPQALPGSKMASAGSDWQTNAATQIKWGLGYINDRYGTPSNAYAQWQARSPHWYSMGGRVPDWGGWNAAGGSFNVTRPTVFGAGEAGPERVTISKGGGAAGRGGIHVEIHRIDYRHKGDIRNTVREELAGLADDLEQMGAR